MLSIPMLAHHRSVRESQKLETSRGPQVTNSIRAALGGRGNPNSVGLNSNTFGQTRTSLDPRISSSPRNTSSMEQL
jgi:hypothetical protein